MNFIDGEYLIQAGVNLEYVEKAPEYKEVYIMRIAIQEKDSINSITDLNEVIKKATEDKKGQIE